MSNSRMLFLKYNLSVTYMISIKNPGKTEQVGDIVRLLRSNYLRRQSRGGNVFSRVLVCLFVFVYVCVCWFVCPDDYSNRIIAITMRFSGVDKTVLE